MLRETSWSLVSLSVAFIAFASAMTVGVAGLAGRSAGPESIVTRVPGIQGVVKFLQDSDGTLVRDQRILGTATAWRLVVAADLTTSVVRARFYSGQLPPSQSVIVTPPRLQARP